MDKKNGIFKRVWAVGAVRCVVYLAVVILIWQALYMSGRFPEILFPSVKNIASSLITGFSQDGLLQKTGYSLRLIVIGLGISVVLTAVLTVLCLASKTVKDLVLTLVSVFDPLPGIALLPIAILWFGIGESAIVFVMLHSILWPMLLNIIGGFDSVPVIYREVGRSIGLRGARLALGVYIPASVPGIITGFKTGWSRAWRALISAEMVFGATGALGGLGWDIYIKRSYLDMSGMFATLIVIMAIGVIVEKVVFKNIERLTVRKWGMVQ